MMKETSERSPLLEQRSKSEPGVLTRNSASSEGAYGVCVGTTTGKQEVKSTPTRHLLFDLPIRKKLLLLCICLSSLSEGVLLSMIAPFFPYVAEQRGITSVYVGLVFAVFALIVLISAQVWGIMVKITGPKSMYVTGLLVCGFSVILFGILYFTPSNATFIWMSVLTRCVESLGASAFLTAGYTIVSASFQELTTIVAGLMTAFSSVGFIIGPVFGGALFQAIGYTAALSTAGGIMFVIAIIGCIFIPADIKAPVLEERPRWPMLRDPRVLLTLASLMFATGIVGLISSTLVLSLKKFNISLQLTSLVFLAPASGRVVFVIIIGNISDRFPKYSRLVVIVGLFVAVIGIFFHGPAPFIPVPDSVALRLSSAFITISGLSINPIFFTHLHEASKRLHMPDDLATHGMISGLFVSAVNAGMFWGPLLAGALYDKIGFRWDATIFGFFILIMAILQAMLLVYDFLYPPKPNGLPLEEEDGTLRT